ncbi:MAG: hypothetical protein JO317_06840 [Verrucomicrobiae bacterium]|nr:hypothetical protein [Verrucomicrobiae bacterium]
MVFLIDSSNLYYRCFHAIQKLTNSKGFPTNAIHGVLKTLRLWMRTHNPDHIALVVDGETCQERLDLLPGYKATRKPMPDDLKLQMPILGELTELLGIPSLCDPKQEADDLIATLAVQARAAGHDVVVASNDKDFFQLLEPGVTILRQTPKESVRVDEAWLAKEWGLRPDQIVDYLSLVGDSVDEIPGVQGVGEKTALQWLTKYESLEGIFEHLQELPERFQARMKGELPRLEINRKLITLRRDLPMKLDLDAMQRRAPDYDPLFAKFRELEIKSLMLEMQKERDGSSTAPAPASSASSPQTKVTPKRKETQGELF